jgi:transcriptional regulator with XRE-family HTH domain
MNAIKLDVYPVAVVKPRDEDLPNRIRELRHRRAADLPTLFTPTALAGRLGVAQDTLLRWERGSLRPRRRHAQALARELGVNVEDLKLDASD